VGHPDGGPSARAADRLGAQIVVIRHDHQACTP
jgi:hypothetical protein